MVITSFTQYLSLTKIPHYYSVQLAKIQGVATQNHDYTYLPGLTKKYNPSLYDYVDELATHIDDFADFFAVDVCLNLV